TNLSAIAHSKASCDRFQSYTVIKNINNAGCALISHFRGEERRKTINHSIVPMPYPSCLHPGPCPWMTPRFPFVGTLLPPPEFFPRQLCVPAPLAPAFPSPVGSFPPRGIAAVRTPIPDRSLPHLQSRMLRRPPYRQHQHRDQHPRRPE
ncbi:hypothetical protein T310_8760, partial [Rasamsonia emersonii CBS 393.64]